MTTKIFWSTHFSNAVQGIEELVRLMSFIDENKKTVLVVIPSKENPPIQGFLDKNHLSKYGVPNRLVLPTGKWGFPAKVEFERVGEFIRANYKTSLSEDEHYIFGQSTQDCVARMGRAIAYGTGFSYSDANTILESVDVSNGFPDFGMQVRSLEHVHLIEELCHPNKRDCTHESGLPEDYCDFIRIYDANGRLQRKAFVTLDSVILGQ